jgi:hypothetical protein
LHLQVTGESTAPDLMIEAWSGEPGDDSDGIAVLELPGGLAVAQIPLCSCGDRGCGNAGIQLNKELSASELPALVELLRTLPWTDVVPDHANVARGNDLAALPVIDVGSGPWKVVYRGGRGTRER